MSQRNHGHHQDHHSHGHHEGHHGGKKRGLHKDWRTWIVVGLMLAAMAVYLLTIDESFIPGGPAESPVPADAAAE